MRNVDLGRGEGGALWFVGHQEGVDAAGMEEVVIYLVKEGIGSVVRLERMDLGCN